MNNKFVYIWAYENQEGKKIPFYVGQGTHQKHNTHRSKYSRAYARHLTSSRKVAECQIQWDNYVANGINCEIVIMFDNLTQELANRYEYELVNLLVKSYDGGTLCNVCNGGIDNPMNYDYIVQRQLDAMQTPEFRKRMSEIVTARQEDPEYFDRLREAANKFYGDPAKKAKWYNEVYTDEMREKLSSVQAEATGKKITHDGIEYRSICELARFLGISKQLVRYRLKNDIPLDLIPNKGNNPNNKKGRKKCK